MVPKNDPKNKSRLINTIIRPLTKSIIPPKSIYNVLT
jgi:hypothetical protein